MLVPATDAELHVSDTPGGDPALVFLNGGFGTVRNWKPIVSRLGGRYRIVRFDGRGRGRSSRSADYTTASAVADVGRVLAATGIERPILVGWSHGATLAVGYATEHPEEIAGLVLVDGAYPITMFDEEAKTKARALFRRLAWPMRILALFGLSGRMSAAEAAEIVIDLDQANGELDFSRLSCPAAFVVATGPHTGATEADVNRMRAAVDKAVTSNHLVSVFATVPANHVQVLNKAADTVTAAIDHVAELSLTSSKTVTAADGRSFTWRPTNSA